MFIQVLMAPTPAGGNQGGGWGRGRRGSLGGPAPRPRGGALELDPPSERYHSYCFRRKSPPTLLPSNTKGLFSYSSGGQISKIKVSAGLHSFSRLQRRICLVFFLASRSYLHSLALGPSLPLQRQQALHSDLWFPCHIFCD